MAGICTQQFVKVRIFAMALLRARGKTLTYYLVYLFRYITPICFSCGTDTFVGRKKRARFDSQDGNSFERG